MSLVEAAMRTVAGLLLVRLCGCGAIELTVGSMTVCDVVQAGVGGRSGGRASVQSERAAKPRYNKMTGEMGFVCGENCCRNWKKSVNRERVAQRCEDENFCADRGSSGRESCRKTTERGSLAPTLSHQDE